MRGSEKVGEFEHESAGNLMSSDIPIISSNKTISDVELLLSKNHFETVGYIYCVNKNNELEGVISVKDLFRNSKRKTLRDIMNKNVISVRANTDQERVALLALKHQLKTIPVVNKENKILGAITSKTIFNIFHSEGIEDILHSAGIRKFKDPARDIIQASTFVHLKKRMPWLLIGLIGGILAALIVRSFESILDLYIILAAFIPAVVYMADAVGSQSQTIFIRSMALDKELNYLSYSGREFKINLFLGILLGLIFYLIILIGWKSSFFGLVLGVSIIVTVFISMSISILLPIIFNKINIDPAVSTGPLATSIRDLTSLMVYFGIASLMIKLFL